MGTRWAVLSDIHANIEALDAVLADAAAQEVDKIAVLGDVIDYGPDPIRCLERVAEVAEVRLVGNHEAHLVRHDPYQGESSVLRWSQPLLAASPAWDEVRRRIERDGAEAHASRVVDQRHFVHASARHPITQYVWPAAVCQYLVFNDQIDQRLAEFLEEFQTPHGFNGHTHVPAVLTSYQHHRKFDHYRGVERDPVHSFMGPTMLFFVPSGPCVLREVGGMQLAVNVGSVGQPRRLGDNRASYVITDGDDLEFRRVPYAWQHTADKLGGLSFDSEQKAELIERLRTGV